MKVSKVTQHVRVNNSDVLLIKGEKYNNTISGLYPSLFEVDVEKSSKPQSSKPQTTQKTAPKTAAKAVPKVTKPQSEPQSEPVVVLVDEVKVSDVLIEDVAQESLVEVLVDTSSDIVVELLDVDSQE